MIADAETAYRVDEDVPSAFYCRRWFEALQRANAQKLGLVADVPVWDVPVETSHDAPAYAYVSGGRWVVDCTNPVCGSAQIASSTDHRFFCCDCANVHVGGAFIEAIWPDNPDVIDGLLSQRPFKFNQNWLAHETVDDLARENVEHGIVT